VSGDDVCALCKAPIFWATSVNGASMPIDAEPVPDGNVLVSRSRAHPDRKKCVVLAHAAEKPKNRRLFVSHFATCPAMLKRRQEQRRGARKRGGR